MFLRVVEATAREPQSKPGHGEISRDSPNYICLLLIVMCFFVFVCLPFCFVFSATEMSSALLPGVTNHTVPTPAFMSTVVEPKVSGFLARSFGHVLCEPQEAPKSDCFSP